MGMRRGIPTIVVLLAAFALTGCGTGGGGGDSTALPTETPTEATAQAPGPIELVEGEADLSCAVEGDITLVDADGAPAALVSGAGPAVLIAPQVYQSICAMDAFARDLVAAGYRAVQVDVNAHPVEMLVAAASWVGTADGPLALLGASRGGTDVLAAAPEVHPAVVVALSPPAEFQGVDAEAAMADINAPVLIVAGADDGTFADEAQTLADAGGDGVTLQIVPDTTDHGVQFLSAESPIRQQVLDFLASGLQ